MKKKIALLLSALLVSVLAVLGLWQVNSGNTIDNTVENNNATQVESLQQQQEEIESLKAEIESLKEIIDQTTIEERELEEVEESADTLKEASPLIGEANAETVAQQSSNTAVETPAKATTSVTAEYSTSTATVAEKQNAGTIFEGYSVSITDSSTIATTAAGFEWPIQTYYFLSSSGVRLGSITGKACEEIMMKYKVIGTSSGAWLTPDGKEDWSEWFAVKFNELRWATVGTTGGGVGNSTSNDVDLDVYAYEIIELVNKERKDRGLNSLTIDNSLMEHSIIRAQELSVQFSHMRPNGTKETNECAAMGQNTPSATIAAWMKSDDHRVAIINENGRFNYNYIGAGCFRDNAGKFYWIVTFAV